MILLLLLKLVSCRVRQIVKFVAKSRVNKKLRKLTGQGLPVSVRCFYLKSTVA